MWRGNAIWITLILGVPIYWGMLIVSWLPQWQDTLTHGLSFGTPTEQELTLATLIYQAVPSMEKLRLVNSGTEATMSAIRLARGFTKRNYLLKFTGCYHGHSDSLLVNAGSGLLTLSPQNTQASSAGVLPCVASHTFVLPYNDIGALKILFQQAGDSIAGVIIEPIAGNMNLVIPHADFLFTLRNLCTQYGALLIFDEVMTGFRVALGGVQTHYQITPDLTTLGKVIGGGLPIGAFGGRSEIMDKLAPQGDVYQAGTLSGNPVAVSAGIVVLNRVQQTGFYEELARKTRLLASGITDSAKRLGIACCAQSIGGMFGIYFQNNPPHTLDEVKQGNQLLFKQFFHFMLERGFYFAPSAFEAGFVSQAHSEDDIAETVATAEEFFAYVTDLPN